MPDQLSRHLVFPSKHCLAFCTHHFSIQASIYKNSRLSIKIGHPIYLYSAGENRISTSNELSNNKISEAE